MARAVVSGLHALGIYDAILDGPAGPKRLDAGESQVMARELEYVFAEVYRKEFPDLVGRQLFPVKSGVPSGAESHTYTEVERFGQAKIIHNYATDFPSTEVQGKQFSDVIRGIGDSYQYSIQDLRASALTKIKLPLEKAEAAREVMERKLDELALTGDDTTGLKGFNSASMVANYSAVAKTTAGTAWPNQAGLTASEVLADVRNLFKKIPEVTKNKHRANTLAVDTATYNFLAFTERSIGSTSFSDSTTLLQYLLQNVPGLQAVIPWARLDTAGAAGVSRIFAFDRNPSVIYQVIPQDFEQMPPQARNMAFVVNCHMRFGGLVSPYPKAIAYMDKTGS
jgi:hypothetical protein